jgi:hypothetical protein
MPSWGKLCRLSGPERWALAQALVLLPLTALALRWLGLRRWQSALARLAPRGGDRAVSGDDRAHATARMVQAAARYGPCRANCLQQSLVLWWLLRRRGVASVLRIGVRKGEGRLEAHAWVEHRGQALNDQDVGRRYVPFGRAIGGTI